jgi:hypothetical protein
MNDEKQTPTLYRPIGGDPRCLSETAKKLRAAVLANT